MFRVSVNHSEVTRPITVYMVKPRGVHVVVFVLLTNHFTESIIRKYIAEFEREENVGENQNSDKKMFSICQCIVVRQAEGDGSVCR